MSAEAKAVCGWFSIEEDWNLYVDGDLQLVYVDMIHVDEKTTEDGYVCKHYDRAGDLITVVSLDYDDLRPITLDMEAEDRPAHI